MYSRLSHSPLRTASSCLGVIPKYGASIVGDTSGLSSAFTFFTISAVIAISVLLFAMLFSFFLLGAAWSRFVHSAHSDLCPSFFDLFL